MSYSYARKLRPVVGIAGNPSVFVFFLQVSSNSQASSKKRQIEDVNEHHADTGVHAENLKNKVKRKLNFKGGKGLRRILRGVRGQKVPKMPF